MKKPAYFTPEQRELLVDICTTMSVWMNSESSNSSNGVSRMCNKYCFKRTKEIIDILTGNPPKNNAATTKE